MKTTIFFAIFAFVSSLIEVNAQLSCPNVISTTRCPCPVTLDINPVCGSDGRTYINLATLGCVERCGGKDVRFAHRGCCRRPNPGNVVSVPSCPCPTTKEIRYVCGSDGRTYINPSTLRCAKTCGEGNIRQLYEGFCRY